jgi:CheY-like chemotaxis protein
VNLLILVVDDEPDVEVLFRQQFRRDLRARRLVMEFAQSASMALQRIADAGEARILITFIRGTSAATNLSHDHAFRGSTSKVVVE